MTWTAGDMQVTCEMRGFHRDLNEAQAPVPTCERGSVAEHERQDRGPGLDDCSGAVAEQQFCVRLGVGV